VAKRLEEEEDPSITYIAKKKKSLPLCVKPSGVVLVQVSLASMVATFDDDCCAVPISGKSGILYFIFYFL